MINGMIGAGIFGVPAELARLTGGFSPTIFLLGALLMTPVILCFAELGGSVSGSGGPVRYVGIAFGAPAGFQAGWALYIARLTAFAANINLLASTVVYFWPSASAPPVRNALMIALVALMAWANVLSVRGAIRSLGTLTLLKLLPLALLIVFGIGHIDPGEAGSLIDPASEAEVGSALLLVIYAFVGFEAGLIPAGEARHPRRDMPRALLWSLAVCAVLYALLQWVSVSALPRLAASTRPLVDVGEALLGPVGAAILIVGVLASIGGNLVGSMFSSPRITYSLATLGQLPEWFGRVHARFETPAASVVFYAAAAAMLAISGSFVWLAGLSVLTRLLLFLGCIAAVPRVRAQADIEAAKATGEDRDTRSLRLPAGRVIPILAAAVCLGLLTQVSLRAWIATGALLAVGSVLYLLALRARRGG